MNKLRWGILSTANIGKQNWKAIHLSGNSVVAAVASRDLGRSRQFIEHNQAEARFETAPEAFGSYEAMLASDSIDAVYIPLPTGLRKDWVLRAAAVRKHVLCEKPCGASLSDVQAMTDACRRQGVQFMDGVMFMHNPRLNRLREAIDDADAFGKIKRMTSSFSFAMDKTVYDSNVRMNGSLEPAGCLGDLGWYCIRFFLWAMRWKLPVEVTGRILSQRGSRSSPVSAPTEFSGELLFADGVSAAFYCSFLAQYQQWANLGGTKGWIHLPDFVHPRSDHEPSFEINQTEVPVKVCDWAGAYDDNRAGAQDVRMIRNFVDQVCSGRLNEEWPIIALKTQQVLDACLHSAQAKSRPVIASHE
jgi:predicted dehydrogenase